MSIVSATGLLRFFNKIAEFFSKAASVLRDLIRDVSDSYGYRREQHCVRGLGPKWRAKYQRVDGDDSAVLEFDLARARARRR
ncbi:hypothetical protein [Bradyrhizobium sp. CCBAU 51745]|uniref:hypothetical protein n=1 Tax=Bradyrhizobium sp. CCBAU 51745 TaxID=1325099 RepID=UPI002305FC04|nr:hypothetical protein [Bradyrhizobium sp. CCBAU 51745]